MASNLFFNQVGEGDTCMFSITTPTYRLHFSGSSIDIVKFVPWLATCSGIAMFGRLSGTPHFAERSLATPICEVASGRLGVIAISITLS